MWYLWFNFSGIWCCVVCWAVPIVSNDHNAFTSRDCLTLKMKALWFFKTGTHKFSQSLDARKMTKSKVHSEDPKFWSNPWNLLLSGAFCPMQVSWYRFLCVYKKNCKNWIKILGATLHNLVNQNLGTSTFKQGEHFHTNTASHSRILCSTDVRASDFAP